MSPSNKKSSQIKDKPKRKYTINPDNPPGHQKGVFKIETPEGLQQKIDEYFKQCDETIIVKQVVQKGQIIKVPTPTPYTMEGLAEHLNIDRRTLLNYNNRERCFPIIAQARHKVARQNIELGLIGCHDPRIAALNLASNFGYSEKRDDTVTFTVDDTLQLLLSKLPAELASQVMQELKLIAETRRKELAAPINNEVD